MRRILPLAAAFLLAGCVARAPAPAPVNTPAPAAPTKQVVHHDLIGATAGQLIQIFGQPALQVREGSGLKLQFRGSRCILDAYLYAQGTQGERVTHVDTRVASGNSIDRDQCVNSLLRI